MSPAIYDLLSRKRKGITAMPRYRAKISSDGQLTVPATVRDHLDLKAGDIVEFHIDDADRSVRVTAGNKSIPDQLEGFDMPAGFDEAGAEYMATPHVRGSRRSIFDHLDELKLPSIGRPVTRADIDAAIGEAMEEQERRIRNQRQ